MQLEGLDRVQQDDSALPVDTSRIIYEGESPEIVDIKVKDDAYLFQYPKRAGNTTPLFKIPGTDYWISLGPKQELGLTIAIMSHSLLVLLVSNHYMPPVAAVWFGILDVLFTLNVMLIAYGDPGRRTKPVPLSEYLQHRGNYKCEACLTKFGSVYSHCSKCDYCTEYLDHHCGLLGNCVGRRTLWAFYLLLPLGLVYLLGCAAVYACVFVG